MVSKECFAICGVIIYVSYCVMIILMGSHAAGGWALASMLAAAASQYLAQDDSRTVKLVAWVIQYVAAFFAMTALLYYLWPVTS